MDNLVPKKFQRKIEDFTCGNCGEKIKGNGYTNHCPKCLWSRHVDVNPGDRAADCGGMMAPADIEVKSGEYTIIHQCIECRHEKKNKTVAMDDMNRIIEISRR